MLSTVQIKSAKPKDRAYKIADNGGLFLLVQPSGSKLWRYKFRIGGVEGLDAIGAFPEVTLAEARQIHADARKLVAQGINPVQARKAKKEALIQAHLSREKGSFATMTADWGAATKDKLRPNTLKQREREINKHLLPAFGNRQISSITRVELTSLLKTAEAGRPEVARNLRNYLWGIFEYAINTGLLDSNPVPPPQIMKARQQKNHPALPPAKISDFMRTLDDASVADESTRIAMKLVILTACRKSEVIGGEWAEIDLDAAKWEIPAERMKPNRPHYIPLSKQATTLLRRLRTITPEKQPLLFPNRRDPKRPMANRSLNALMERLGYNEIGTPHGMRAAFSTHFNERFASGSKQSKAGAEAIEYCLSHIPMGKTRAAYNRYEYMKERKAILQEWADHLEKTGRPEPRSVSRG